MKINPVKGCLDYLPKEAELRQQIIEIILKTYKNNGFLQVKTPILENLENLINSDGGENEKLMFKTIKRGAKLDLNKENLTENDIVEEGLRYDLTVPLARLFTKYRNDLPYPFKSIQIDDSFRAEKPQVGRNRQLTQCDIDIWGFDSILGEIEIITTTMEAYYNLGLRNVTCKISNRRILMSIILNAGIEKSKVNEVCIIIDKLDKIGLDGCEKELELINIEEKTIKNLLSTLKTIQEQGVDCLQSFGAIDSDINEIKNLIDSIKEFLPESYNIQFDISVVRGQGYYTSTVFEMYYYGSEYSFAIGGGGRYDKMYGKFAGTDVPAVGYGLGLDRVVLILSNRENSFMSSKKLALIYKQEDDIYKIMNVKAKLKKNYDVSIFPQPKNFKEFLRRIKLNGFNFIAKLDKDGIEQI